MVRRTVIVSCLQVSALLAGPTGEEILRRAVDGQLAQQALRSQYCYRQTIEHRKVDNDGGAGKLNFTREYEIQLLEGGLYRKLVLINGKPLKPDQARAEEQRMQETAAKRRDDKAKGVGRSRSVVVGEAGLSDILRLMRHTLLREETIEGRPAWVVQSEPSDDARIESPRDARTLCYRYLHWIDQQALVVARQEFEVIRDGVDALPGTKSLAVFAKEGDSPWFLRRLEGSFRTSRGRWIEQSRFWDFKKFDAQSLIEFEPEPPPMGK